MNHSLKRIVREHALRNFAHGSQRTAFEATQAWGALVHRSQTYATVGERGEETGRDTHHVRVGPLSYILSAAIFSLQGLELREEGVHGSEKKKRRCHIT